MFLYPLFNVYMERARLELATLGLEDRCSIQLSYRSKQI